MVKKMIFKEHIFSMAQAKFSHENVFVWKKVSAKEKGL